MQDRNQCRSQSQAVHEEHSAEFIGAKIMIKLVKEKGEHLSIILTIYFPTEFIY